MRIRIFLAAILGTVVVTGLSSCSMNSAGGGIKTYLAYDRPAKLPDNPSAVEVKVSLSKQRVYVMEGDEMLLAMPVSVGKSSSPTPHGTFRIYKKEAKYRNPSYGYARSGEKLRQVSPEDTPPGWSFRGTPMPYWCEFKPDYAFHTGWIKHSPCTNGCIRMHKNLAPKFFRLVSVGTPVDISYTQPEDARWANIPLPPDAGPLPDYSKMGAYWDGEFFTRHKTPEFE